MKFTAKPLVLLFIAAFLSSCVDNLDFDQVNLDIDPIVNSPLVYLDVDQNDFFDDTTNAEISAIADVSDLTIFQSSVVRENLTRVVFNFEIENGFNRGFTINVVFLDDNDNVTYTVNPDLLIGPGVSDYSATRTISLASSPQLLNSSKVRINLTISNSSTPIDPDIPQFLSFKSAGIYYLSF